MVADVVDDLVNVVAQGAGGGIGFPIIVGDGQQNFDRGKPLAKCTPKKKEKEVRSGQVRRWGGCTSFTFHDIHRGIVQTTCNQRSIFIR